MFMSITANQAKAQMKASSFTKIKTQFHESYGHRRRKILTGELKPALTATAILNRDERVFKSYAYGGRRGEKELCVLWQ